MPWEPVIKSSIFRSCELLMIWVLMHPGFSIPKTSPATIGSAKMTLSPLEDADISIRGRCGYPCVSVRMAPRALARRFELFYFSRLLTLLSVEILICGTEGDISESSNSTSSILLLMELFCFMSIIDLLYCKWLAGRSTSIYEGFTYIH